MADYGDVLFRMIEGSDVVRVRSGGLVQVYESGTATLTWEGTADNNGNWTVNALPTGKYDVKVDGQLARTIHHVKADHVHSPDESWRFFKSGAITGDQDEVNTMPIYGGDAAGSIVKVIITSQTVDATGDVTVHLLKGAAGGASVLTVAADSTWNHKINPGGAEKRYLHVDNNPGITVSANECVTLGIDHTANTVEGLTVLVVFRPA
jgi:hypothetical protein